MENTKVLQGVQFVLSLVLKIVGFIICRDFEKEKEQSRPLNDE